MRFLLTGASGLVGNAFARRAAPLGHEIIGVVSTCSRAVPGLSRQLVVDLADASAVQRLLEETKPELILNAAAVSEPARCETEPELSDRLNVELPEGLARYAASRGARLIHLSSEQVFNGRGGPYGENDPVDPINRYGRQKVEAERRVAAAAPAQGLSLRLPLLMGNSLGERRSVHERLFTDWSEGRTPKLFTDEFRQTCTAENLAELFLELAARPDLTGLFHWAGAELLSRHEMGRRIREHFKLPENKAALATTHRGVDPAASSKRHASLPLNVSRLSQQVRTPVESFARQLAVLKVPSYALDWHARTRAG